MALGGVTRSISIALSLATQGFNAGLNSASASMNSFASGSKKSLNDVALAAGAVGVAVGAGMGIAINGAMGFTAAMSNVEAMTGATGRAMGMLSDQAIEVGASSIYTATEVANAQAELAKAGLSTAAILGGALDGAVNLAAAAQIELASAAEYTAVVLNQFNLPARDAAHVADVLAAAANKSAADVDGLMLGLRQVGTAASIAGMDFEETASALSIFSNAGMKGSDAGTSLKTMLLRLNPVTEKAAGEMAKWGLVFKDEQDNYDDMATVAEKLQVAFQGVGEAERVAALQTIFGQDAIRASALLYESGAEGVNKMTAEIDDNGYAADVAAIKMDNLSGDVEKFKGAVDTAFIKAGASADGALRNVTQTATSVVQQLGDLPPVFSGITMGAGGLVVGITGLIAGFGSFIPMARNVKDALYSLGGGWSTLGGAMSMGNAVAIAGSLAVVTAAFTIAATQIQGAKRRGQEDAQEFLATLDMPTDAATNLDYYNSIVARHNQLVEKLGESYNKSGVDLGEVGMRYEKFYERINVFGEDTFTQTEESIDALRETLAPVGAQLAAQESILGRLAGQLGMTTEEVEKLAETTGVDLMGASQAAMIGLEEQGVGWDDVNGKIELTTRGTRAVRDAMEELTPQIKAAQAEANAAPPALNDVAGAMEGISDETKTAEERLKAFEDAVTGVIDLALNPQKLKDDVTEAVWAARDAATELNKVNWHGFGDAMPEAIAYRGEMEALVRTIGEQVTGIRETTNSQAEMDAAISVGIQSLEDMRTAGLINTEQFDKYAGIIRNIPANADTNIQTPGLDPAIVGTQALNGELDKINVLREVRINTGQAMDAFDQIQARAASIQILAGTANPFRNAEGHIYGLGGVMAFADGGHTAQIARGGPARLWNEPETGGESYIPWAQSKRARSVEILRQTNAGFGNPLGGGTVVNLGGVNVTAPHYVGNKQELLDFVADGISRDPRIAEKVGTAVTRASGARDGAR